MNMLGKVAGDDRQCLQFAFRRADIYSWFEGLFEIKYLQFSKKVEMVENQFVAMLWSKFLLIWSDFFIENRVRCKKSIRWVGISREERICADKERALEL